MPWICGVEEAGRGPVLGPMVMACCWVREEDEPLLRKVGARDSKLLSPGQREDVFDALSELRKKGKVGYELVIVTPQEIDKSVLGDGDNLNKLELRTSATLINKALREQALAKALIDCPTANTAKYAADIRRLLDKDVEVIAEHKADVHYPVVSAASILAKVTRDAEIRKLHLRLGTDIGSGYPADPATQAFVRKYWDEPRFKDVFRTSWASYKAVAESSKQRSLFHFGRDEETGDGMKGAERAKALQELSVLRRHGFAEVPTTSPHEAVRLKGPDATVIRYTTGKLLVQGKGKARVERLLRKG